MTLPTPDSAFHWTTEAWGRALRCKPLSAIAQHAFTTKQLQLRPSDHRQTQGHPEPARGRANSGRHDPPQGRLGSVEEPIGWTLAAAAVGCGIEQVMRVRQVHGAGVRVLKKEEVGPRAAAETPEGDAMVSNASGLVLAVQVADCVPILIADHRSGSVAAVHAGWRGTCAGVARAAVLALVQEFGANPADLIAAIGPSIGPCCYTIGSNVLDWFRHAGASGDETGRWFVEGDERSLRLDLWSANRDQLMSVGLRADCVHVCGLCTKTHHDLFESYRVDGERAGRMAALIAVP